MRVCVCVCVCVCVYVHAHARVYVCMCKCMGRCVHVRTKQNRVPHHLLCLRKIIETEFQLWQTFMSISHCKLTACYPKDNK